ncbi:MAG: ABC transporter substrate-binding protein [Clostridia bacterium]|nr:ABC transporter substrate-binding protein [Clostridia bacterium]MBQ9925143.1 ABC transporter substrate-binding protein [Clostridia bacterium]
MTKRILAFLMAMIMMLSMVACGSEPAEEGKTEEKPSETQKEETKEEQKEEEKPTGPKEGGTFIVPINSNSLTSLTPYSIYGSDDGQMAAEPCYDSLFIVSSTGTRWYLAESLEPTADDGCHWQMKLKDGLTWHDGEAITADDVVWTVKMLQNKDNAGKVSQYVEYDGRQIVVEKVDDLTVSITLEVPYSAFESEFGRIKVLPEHVFGGETYIKEMTDELNLCIGSGPFKFKEYIEGEAIVYERYDDYYGGKPMLDQVIIKMMPDLSAQEAALQTGEISMMRVTSQAKLDKYKADDDYTVYSIPEGRLNYMAFNYQCDIWKNPDARKAVCLALNVDEIILGGYGSEELALPAKNFCSPENFYYNNEMEGYQQNIEEAKRLAEETGLTDMTLNYIYFTARPNMKETAQIVQQQLKAIGVEVNVQGLSAAGEFFGHLFAAWRGGKTTVDTEWDLATNGMDSLNADPATKMSSWKSPLIQVGMYMSDETIDLWNRASQAIDVAEREKLYKELQVQFNEDYSIYPMANTNYVMVARKEFKGLDALEKYPVFEDYTKIYVE